MDYLLLAIALWPQELPKSDRRPAPPSSQSQPDLGKGSTPLDLDDAKARTRLMVDYQKHVRQVASLWDQYRRSKNDNNLTTLSEYDQKFYQQYTGRTVLVTAKVSRVIGERLYLESPVEFRESKKLSPASIGSSPIPDRYKDLECHFIGTKGGPCVITPNNDQEEKVIRKLGANAFIVLTCRITEADGASAKSSDNQPLAFKCVVTDWKVPKRK